MSGKNLFLYLIQFNPVLVRLKHYNRNILILIEKSCDAICQGRELEGRESLKDLGVIECS